MASSARAASASTRATTAATESSSLLRPSSTSSGRHASASYAGFGIWTFRDLSASTSSAPARVKSAPARRRSRAPSWLRGGRVGGGEQRSLDVPLRATSHGGGGGGGDGGDAKDGKHDDGASNTAPPAHAHPVHAATSTWLHATVIIIGEIMGSGILSLPYAMSQLGWVLGSSFCAVFALCAVYSGRLLSRTRNEFYPDAESFGDLAEVQYGGRMYTDGGCSLLTEQVVQRTGTPLGPLG